MTRAIESRAWVPFVLLPALGLVSGIVSAVIVNVAVGVTPAFDYHAANSGFGGVIFGVFAMAVWPVVVYRRSAIARVGLYVAVMAVLVAALALTQVPGVWSSLHFAEEPPPPGPTAVVWLVAVGGSALAAGILATIVAMTSLRRHPAGPDGPRQPVATVRRRALHLLWTVPLALFLSLPFLFIAALSVCGISGCSGGGFGVSTESRGDTWVNCLAIVDLIGISIAVVPWLRPWWARVAVGAGVGLLVGGGFALFFLRQML